MCNHEDYPCCGCDTGVEEFDDSEVCPSCGEPEVNCRCNELAEFEDDFDDDFDEDEEFEDADLDESMDGDFDTGMASAGFGTDEDYGNFGGDFDG